MEEDRTHYNSTIFGEVSKKDEFIARDLQNAYLSQFTPQSALTKGEVINELDRKVIELQHPMHKLASLPTELDLSSNKPNPDSQPEWQSLFDLPEDLVSAFTIPVDTLPAEYYSSSRLSPSSEDSPAPSPHSTMTSPLPKPLSGQVLLSEGGVKRKIKCGPAEEGNGETNKKTKTRDTSDVSSAQSRAQRQREAARRYRRRKKARMEKLQQDVERLAEEKKELLKQNEKIQEHLRAVRIENIQLKKKHSVKAEMLEKQRKEHVEELSRVFCAGAEDEELRPILRKLQDHCKKVEKLGQCHWKHLISPDSISQLASAGVFNKTSKEAGRPAKDEGILNFIQKIVDVVKTLTPEQVTTIRGVVMQYFKELQPIRDDQKVLDQQVRELIKSASPTAENIIEKLAVLEELRRSMALEADLYQQAAQNIFHVMSPRQQALFYLKVEAEYANVMRLKEIWTALNPEVGEPSCNTGYCS